MIALLLPWPPSVNHYWVHTKVRTFISAKGQAYRAELQLIIRQAKIYKPIQGRVHIILRLSPPDRRRRDIDNGLKCLLDALVWGGLLEDDSQIKQLDITMCDRADDDLQGIVEFYLQRQAPREAQLISNNKEQ